MDKIVEARDVSTDTSDWHAVVRKPESGEPEQVVALVETKGLAEFLAGRDELLLAVRGAVRRLSTSPVKRDKDMAKDLRRAMAGCGFPNI